MASDEVLYEILGKIADGEAVVGGNTMMKYSVCVCVHVCEHV